MNDLKYYQILKENKFLSKQNAHLEPYKIALLSNCIVNQLKEILEYSLQLKGVNTRVDVGNYDNILQDANVYKKHNSVIVFFELFNLAEGFFYNEYKFSDSQLIDFIDKTKSELSFLIDQLKDTPLVFINKFQSVFFNNDRLNYVADELNTFLVKSVPPNFQLIDLNKHFLEVSIEKSVDWKNFYNNKMPFTVDFFKSYVKSIQPAILAVQGKSKKVLVLDCDNTLWKGVVGEDGIEGIKISQNDKIGGIFAEIQTLMVKLKNQGVLLCLCSKNNQTDVDEVFEKHPGMILKETDITLKKINWEDKATNLKAIAKELNLGLDSIVFVDDSDFEINLIREKIPEVECIQVPKDIFLYPKKIRDAMSFFYFVNISEEDKKRNKIYKEQVNREQAKNQFSNIEDYLRALEIKLEVFSNEKNQITRLAQMTQKTNQFNLTTKRYTEKEIELFFESNDYDVLSVGVKDKYGDNGITGLFILKYQDEKNALIDTFLMSCRIIGRNIEFILLDYLINYLKTKGIGVLFASYEQTKKNEQVSNLYKKCGFKVIESSNSKTKYSLELSKYNYSGIDYIKFENGK